jgi:small-conductance mechanosensitive channel
MKKTVTMLLLYSILLTSGIHLIPSQANSALPDPQEIKSPGYPVMLGDQTIFYVRDVKGYTAEERARTIAERVKRIAENHGIPVASVEASQYQQPITMVAAGNEMLMAVFEEDARAEGRTRQEVAAEYSEKLRSAIEKYRQDYSLKSILFGALYALVDMLLLLGALYALTRLYRRVDKVIQAWVNSKKISIHIKSFELVRAERIGATLAAATKAIRFAIVLVLIYATLHAALSFFPWTRPVAGRLLSYVVVPFKTIGGAILSEIPDLIYLVVIVMVTVYVLKAMGLFFVEIEKESITFRGFYPEWAQPTYRICRLLVVAFGAVVAFPYIPGSNSPAFKGVSVFLGVLFSLGSSSAVANIISGYTLIYRRIFKVGDRVKIGDFVGDVVATRLQVVHLRTVKNEEITVPSSTIVNSHVTNYSALAKEKGLILHTTVTIGYDAPWRQVEALLLLAAERTPGLLREPPPFILQRSLDDFYVSYELNVYTDAPQAMLRIYTDLHRNIQDAFNEYGVQIMSPNYRGDPAEPKIVPREQWYAAPAQAPGEQIHKLDK